MLSYIFTKSEMNPSCGPKVPAVWWLLASLYYKQYFIRKETPGCL